MAVIRQDDFIDSIADALQTAANNVDFEQSLARFRLYREQDSLLCWMPVWIADRSAVETG